MAYFTIPQKYKSPIITAALLRNLCEDWDVKNVKKHLRAGKLRDPDAEERYYELEREFTTLADFCNSAPFNFVIKRTEGLEAYPGGPDLYFDIEKSRIIFDRSNLYWIPSGIKTKTIGVNDFLTILNIDSPLWDKEDWTGENLTLENIMMLENAFSLQIKLWSRVFNTKTRANEYTNIYVGSKFPGRKLNCHIQLESNMCFFIDDNEKYFEKYFICPNERCFYEFRTQKLLDDHLLHCGSERMKVVQQVLGPASDLLEKAKSFGLIPECGFHRHFLFYDIESVLVPSDISTEKTQVQSTHQLVSIAVNR